MRLQVVTGRWRFESFSALGKLSQFVESWQCNGSYPGHLALRFIPETPADEMLVEYLSPNLFADGRRDVCTSILFDITRARGAKFHTLSQLPWSHGSLTSITTYDVVGDSFDDVVMRAWKACVDYASGRIEYRYDNCAYCAAFFPACAGSCPLDGNNGHCVQLVLQVLSIGFYGDLHTLRSKMIYSGRCIFGCIRHPSYASYSPRLAVMELMRLKKLHRPTPLDDDECTPLTLRPVSFVPLRMHQR